MGLAEDVFGDEPAKQGLADQVFGPEPAKASLADEVFGRADPFQQAVDVTTQWMPELRQAPGFEHVVQRARGGALKGRLRDAEMQERSLKNLEKLTDQQAELQATTQTPRAMEAISEITSQPQYLAPPTFLPAASKAALAGLPKKITEAIIPARYEQLHGQAEQVPFLKGVLQPPEQFRSELEARRAAPPKPKSRGPGMMDPDLSMAFGLLGESAKPVMQPMAEAAGEVLKPVEWTMGLPFRAFGGTLKGAQDWLDYAMTPEGFPQEKPEPAHETIWKSVTGEKPVYTQNVFADAIRQVAGRRELTTAEEIFSHVAGLGVDMLIPGKALEVMRLGAGGTEAAGIAKQAGKALKAGGVPEVEQQAVKALAERVANVVDHPGRVKELRTGLQELGRGMGVGEDVLAQVDRELLRRIGTRGQRLGGTRWVQPKASEQAAMKAQVAEAKRPWGYGHARWKGGEAVPGVPQELAQATSEGLVPMGAQPSFLKRLTAPLSKEITYGGGSAKGAVETIRPSQGYRQAQAMEAIKGGRDLEKMIGSGKRSEELALVQDLYSFRQRNLREIAEVQDDLAKARKAMAEATTPQDTARLEASIQKLEQQLVAKERGAAKALSDTEAALGRPVTWAEMDAGVVATNPREAAAIQAYQGAMDDMLQVERQHGLKVGEVDEYLPHVMTKQARKESLQTAGPGGGKPGGFPHARHRAGTEAGITLGHPGRQFMRRLGDQYQARKMAHSIAVSTKMAERQILQGYGREVAGVMSREMEKRAVSQGLVKYVSSDGRTYLLDRGTAHLLHKMVDPDEIGSMLKTFTKMSTWWKSRATILRPGFTFRNVTFGNMAQLWLADCNVVKDMGLAARVQARMFARSPVGHDTVTRAVVEQLFAKTPKGEKLAKIGNYTIDEVIDQALKHKVIGGGYYGAELGEAMGGFLPTAKSIAGRAAQGVNPFGRANYLMRLNSKINRIGEDNARLALFVNRLRRGYSPAEAARDVAKFVFNYDELAAFGKAARHVLPFFTWNWKNLGLQFSSLMQRPDKYFKFFHAWDRIENMDPMTQEETLDAKADPEFMERGGAFRLPFVRGPEEKARMYALGGGLVPIMSLQQIGVDKLLQGDTGKAGEYAARTIGEMLHPIFRASTYLSQEAESGRPGFFGTPPSESSGYYSWAPTWVSGMMEYAKSSPEIYDKLSNFIRPIKDPNTGTPLGYKWPSEVDSLIQAVDPGMATINRVFRSKNADKAYNTLIATVLGIKPFEMTKGRRAYHQEKQQEEDLKRMRKEKTVRKQLGEQTDERNPYRNYPNY